MNNKILFTIVASLFLLASAASASAFYNSDIYNVYGYQDNYGYQGDYYGNYYDNYYGDYDNGYYANPYGNYYYEHYGYDNEDYNMPIVLGPYPRQYLWHPEDDEDPYNDYLFDDFHGYDSFIGYKDLDIFYPDGTVEVIRNPNSGELPAVDNPEGYKTFGSHVYGYIPGPDGTCLMYKKHYDDHEWEIQAYDYGYNYYASNLAYRITPTATRPCQSTSICQLTHNCC
jgi:hypothetical protein